MPVVAGVLGGSPEIYALALETSVEGILDRWSQAERHPIPPVLVPRGPCKENVQLGAQVNLDLLPVPTWTVEHDPAPFMTSPFVVTKDPDTGIQNMGTYRVQMKQRARTGLMISSYQDGIRHIRKNEALGRPTEIAVVIGADPTVGLVSVSSLGYGVDELAVAGGLRGEPIEVVRCETVDLVVPAAAEIVIEGELLPGEREKEGPFGEYTGYMGSGGDNFVIHVKAMTYRHNPIYQAFVSQMPPSESSCIKAIGREQPLLRHLRDVMRFPVKDVHLRESGGSAAIVVISVNTDRLLSVQELAMATWAYGRGWAKFLVITDDDIDVRDPFAVDWAMSFRVRPEHDIHVFEGLQPVGLDPSVTPWGVQKPGEAKAKAGKVLIDATRKHAYPPVALPPQEHVDRVAANWEAYGFGVKARVEAAV
jgi:UbiD family decarboxylase